MNPRANSGTTYAPPQVLRIKLAGGRTIRARVFQAVEGGSFVARETYALRVLDEPRERAARLEKRGDDEWALREFDGSDGRWGAVLDVYDDDEVQSARVAIATGSRKRGARPEIGYLQNCGEVLDGAKVEVLRRLPSGRVRVAMLEARRAYGVGEVVIVGPGEVRS